MKIRSVEAKLPEWIFTCALKSAVSIHDLCKIFKVVPSTVDAWIEEDLFPPAHFRIKRDAQYFFRGNKKREWFVKTIIDFAKKNEAGK